MSQTFGLTSYLDPDPDNVSSYFDQLLIAHDLTGQRIFDFGSQYGIFGMECGARKADHIICFDYDWQNIGPINQLKKYLPFGDRLQYLELDWNQQTLQSFKSTYGMADLVFCSYRTKLSTYPLLAAITRKICYLETTLDVPEREIKQLATIHGFQLVISINSSKINSYILHKDGSSVQKNNNVSCRYGGIMIPIIGTIYRVGDYDVINYHSVIYHHVKDIYQKIKDIKYVPTMFFYDPYIATPHYDHNLSTYHATDQEKQIIKQQLIDFVIQLCQKGVVHRDLHTNNAHFDSGLLKISNWIVSCVQASSIGQCYDLTGQGMGYSYKIGKYAGNEKHYIFSNSPQSFNKYFNQTLKLSDFISAMPPSLSPHVGGGKRFQLYCADHLRDTFGVYLQQLNNLGGYQFEPFHDPTQPCLFYGLYGENDISVLQSINSYKIVVWTGGDIVLLPKIQARFSKMLKCSKVYHIAISNYIEHDLSVLKLPYKSVPFMGIMLDQFNPIIKGPSIYVYVGTGDETYGRSLYMDVYQRLKDRYHFVFATNPIYAITWTGDKELPQLYAVDKHEVTQLYAQCFICLKLTSHEGLSASTQEAGCMGIKTISNLLTPSTLQYRDIDQIIEHIEHESKSIGTIDVDLSTQVKKFLNVGSDWLFPEIDR